LNEGWHSKGASAGRIIDRYGMKRLLPSILAAWFLVISALRLTILVRTQIGFDGRLYRAATDAWLHGGDPWQVSRVGVFYAAPPPSLLPFVPLTWVPEDLAIGMLIVGSIVASLLAFRRLGMPFWWIAFPPLVDGIWNANVHVLVVPLIVAGLAPLAGLLKIYALAVPLIQRRIRGAVVSVALLLVTAPILPWGQFLGQLPHILEQLRMQSDDGLSVTSFPGPIAVILAGLAIIALVIVGRERASWFAVPVLWPSTQWYYSAMASPGATPLAAFVLAIPLKGGPFLALVVLAIETVVRRRVAAAADVTISGQP
jgi:hypothetical protein